MSAPKNSRLVSRQEFITVKEPAQGSTTKSPSWVTASINLLFNPAGFS